MPRQTMTTVLLLAVILASHNTVSATQLHNSRHLTVDAKCSAESQCVNEPGGCSDAYAYSTSSFPYTLRYTTTGSITNTTFVFQVCSKSCNSVSDELCQPLTDFQLRLDDSLLSSVQFSATPTPQLVTDCTPRGPGIHYAGDALGDLAGKSPATDEVCQSFLVTVPAGGMSLANLCQQGVKIQLQDGTVLFNQEEFGTSCIYVFATASGSGFGAVMADDGMWGASIPPPSPRPTTSPTPPAYGKVSSRRLQQQHFHLPKSIFANRIGDLWAEMVNQEKK